MKKLVSLLLALAMVLSMGLCAAAEEEIVTLTWAQGTGATAPTDNAMVVEALNEISREAIGVECDIQYFTNDEILLSIQSGEIYDMYFTCSWYNNFNQAVSNGIFANIDAYIKEWTPDLYATMTEEVWQLAHSSDGGLYAIPVKKDFAPENFITYPGKIADDFAASEGGYVIPEVISDWDELTEFLVWWKDHNADYGNEYQYPVTIGGGCPGIDTSFDFIDRTAMIGVFFGDEECVVRSVLEDPDVLKRYETLYKWNSLGLVNPDAATLTETAIISDATHMHCNFAQAWDHYDYSPSYGCETRMARFSGPFLSTDGVQGSMTAFSSALEEDLPRLQKALEYQQLVNTDRLYRDTLAYGVEGYHWNYVTEGPCAGAIIKTEQGDYAPWGFSQGNYELQSIRVTQEQADGAVTAPDLNQWAVYYDAVATAPVSTICGFTFNSENVTTQLAQISAIKSEYLTQLTTGTGEDPATLVPKFTEALMASGLQDVIDEAQAQLNDFLAK